MPDDLDLKVFERLSLAIGPSAALRLCAFYGRRSLYVPATIPDGHVIAKLIGREAASYLVAEYGEQTLTIPACELRHLRRAGQVHALNHYQLPTRAIAFALGVTPNRVGQLQSALRLEGYDGLAAEIQAVQE